MGPADREKVRLECNQFFPEQCINMMAPQLGKRERPGTVPRLSELSAKRHDGATEPVEARKTSWRRCVCCSWDWNKKASQAGETACAKLWTLDVSFCASSHPHLIPLTEHTSPCLFPVSNLPCVPDTHST